MTAWTAADEAELDILLGELLSEYERHVAEGCTGCKQARRSDARVERTASSPDVTLPDVSPVGDIEWPSSPVERYKPTSRPARTHVVPGSCCPKIAAGVHVLLDWHEQRMRRTRAEWLRAELDLVEWALEARRQTETRVAA